MNERIQELAEESYNEFYNIHIDLELFVELIVMECIDNIRRVGILEDIENETDMVVNAVKEHFGVKCEYR